MATTVFSVALSDLQEYQPDIAGFGIASWDTQLQHAEDDVIRQVREEWWERYRHTVRYKDITKVIYFPSLQNGVTQILEKAKIVFKFK